MEDLLVRYEKLEKQIVAYKEEAIKLEAEISQLSNQRAELCNQVQALGVDPDKLEEEIAKRRTLLENAMGELQSKMNDLDIKLNVGGGL